MGWDVVQIGLRHNLPVNDPFATAKEVAKRMNRNVRLVYRDKYKYDSAKNVVSTAEGYNFIELGKYQVNSSSNYLQMTVSNYQAHQILNLIGMDKLRKATFEDEYADFIIDDIEDSFELYEIEEVEKTKDSIHLMVFKENVALDVYVIERWMPWKRAFQSSAASWRKRLRDYRMQIYHQAKIFGCNEVIICSDQGPTMEIYDRANLPADELKEYAQSFQYLKDTTWIEEWKKEEWEKDARHIMFSSFFRNKLNFSDEDFVEVIYDDFSDIDNSL